MAKQDIQSVLLEERTFSPPRNFAQQARVKPADLAALHAAAAADHVGFWAEQARRELAWRVPFKHTLDESDAPNYRWFADGRLNVSFNCLDVHLGNL